MSDNIFPINGITRLDLFAAAALIALMAEPLGVDESAIVNLSGDVDDEFEGKCEDQLADAAYRLAYAMERRRAKK